MGLFSKNTGMEVLGILYIRLFSSRYFPFDCLLPFAFLGFYHQWRLQTGVGGCTHLGKLLSRPHTLNLVNLISRLNNLEEEPEPMLYRHDHAQNRSEHRSKGQKAVDPQRQRSLL